MAFFFGLLFFAGLLLLAPFNATVVVRVIRFAGLLPSFGSASTVTLMRHGLPSPALPVSITNDFDGETTLLDFGARGLFDRRPILLLVRAANGDPGRASGSGDVERSEYDMLRYLCSSWLLCN
jgi:hypothetical protein